MADLDLDFGFSSPSTASVKTFQQTTALDFEFSDPFTPYPDANTAIRELIKWPELAQADAKIPFPQVSAKVPQSCQSIYVYLPHVILGNPAVLEPTNYSVTVPVGEPAITVDSVIMTSNEELELVLSGRLRYSSLYSLTVAANTWEHPSSLFNRQIVLDLAAPLPKGITPISNPGIN